MHFSNETAADAFRQSIWLFVLQWVFPVYCFAAVVTIYVMSGELSWDSTFFYLLMGLACIFTFDAVWRGIAMTSRPELAEPTGELLTYIFGRVVGLAAAIATLAFLDYPADGRVMFAMMAVAIGSTLEAFVPRRWRGN